MAGKKKYVIEKKYLETNITYLDFTDRLIIFEPEWIKEEYREPKYLICRAFSGAGCKYENYGTAIFVECIFDKEKFRDSRFNVLNIVKKEYEEEVINKYCLSEVVNA